MSRGCQPLQKWVNSTHFEHVKHLSQKRAVISLKDYDYDKYNILFICKQRRKVFSLLILQHVLLIICLCPEALIIWFLTIQPLVDVRQVFSVWNFIILGYRGCTVALQSCKHDKMVSSPYLETIPILCIDFGSFHTTFSSHFTILCHSSRVLKKPKIYVRYNHQKLGG